jgi:hypothetical protein
VPVRGATPAPRLSMAVASSDLDGLPRHIEHARRTAEHIASRW